MCGTDVSRPERMMPCGRSALPFPSSRSSDAARIPPDATVGDVAGRDPGYAERMGGDVRASARMAGHAASAVAAYAPVIKDMARDLLAQWEAERAAARR